MLQRAHSNILPSQEGPREGIFGGACLFLQAISSTSQEAALTHFSSCWMKAEMLGRFLFKLLTYLHLLPYNISAEKINLFRRSCSNGRSKSRIKSSFH